MLEMDTIEKILEPLLTPDEVCDLLKINKGTLYNWVSQGKIKTFKVGGSLRFKQPDVMALLEERDVQPQST